MQIYVHTHTHRDIVHSCICIDIHFKVVIYIHITVLTLMVSRYICHIHDIPHIYIFMILLHTLLLPMIIY